MTSVEEEVYYRRTKVVLQLDYDPGAFVESAVGDTPFIVEGPARATSASRS